MLYFTLNNKTHKAFSEALKIAREKGVKIVALDTLVTERSINIEDYVEIKM